MTPMFEFDMPDKLKEEIKAIGKKNKPLEIALKKKIREIISRNSETIDYYKNLRNPLNEFKRVHVGSLILTFKVYKERNFIFFESFKHHDEAYK